MRAHAATAASTAPGPSVTERAWAWPVDLTRYVRAPALTVTEAAAVTALGAELRWWKERARPGQPVLPHTRTAPEWQALERLIRPLEDARAALDLRGASQREDGDIAVAAMLHQCVVEAQTFWAWPASTWVRVLGPSCLAFKATHHTWVGSGVRQCLIALAYLLRGFNDLEQLGRYGRVSLASKVFGHERLDAALRVLQQVLGSWGYAPVDRRSAMARALSAACFVQGSPRLGDLTVACLDTLRKGAPREDRSLLQRLQRALAALGMMEPCPGRVSGPMAVKEVDPIWEEWIRRWEATSPLARITRRHIRGRLLRIGRWLHATYPEVREPAAWTRELCAACVAAVDRMHVGDYAQRHDCLGTRLGKPLSSYSKENERVTVRQFFRDCQEWGWIPIRFDPSRALATPRSIKALSGPNPRVIADDVWAKVLWAGLHVQEHDLPSLNDGGQFYPLALVQALAVTWLFGGLRSDEILRLRVGCVRWQREAVAVPGTDGAALPADAICLLDVPVHKTGTAFTKPVDPVLGRAITAWEAVRPQQLLLPDAKTGESVAYLFCYRARRVASRYLNLRLIPLLCRKAGVPVTDARGRITSHRARSTIASQLYNAKEPMTLFELQEWLGHRSPRSTQYYARITPTTLAKAYADADFFARNLRTVEVLLDRDAVQSGRAAAGEPWQYFDLGHGYCTYSFFQQCPHRMACARCDFYVPKQSTQAQLLEAKGNLQRMLATIPLTDDERAAVDDGADAIDRLLERLVDVPTPAGPTPRDLERRSLIPLPMFATPIHLDTTPGGGSATTRSTS